MATASRRQHPLSPSGSNLLIIVTGLNSDKESAQEYASSGVGLLAGSSILLLTVVWGTCVIIGSQKLKDYPKSSGSNSSNSSIKESLTGDTLFSLSCGKLFEGSPEQVKADVTEGSDKLAEAIGDDSEAVVCATGFRPGWDLLAPWKEPEELFETISQALLSSVDRDCLSAYLM